MSKLPPPEESQVIVEVVPARLTSNIEVCKVVKKLRHHLCDNQCSNDSA